MGLFVNYTKKISIHAPRVGSDKKLSMSSAEVTISIHAPRVGSDCNLFILKYPHSHFNPRSPCGERPTPDH